MDFEDYVAADGKRLLRFAYALTGDLQAGEDLVQTALTDAYRHWRRVQRASDPDAYIRRMIVNSHLGWHRRRSSTEVPTPHVVPPGEHGDPADAIVNRDGVLNSLRELPRRAQTVLILRYYADYSDAQIAEFLGVRPGTVRSTASRSLAALRAKGHIEHQEGTVRQ